MAPPRGPASGQGLLDARALWASLVGPQRLAMGAKQSITLSNTRATKIGDNIGAADAYVLIGVFVEPSAAVTVMFSKDDSIGTGSAVSISLDQKGQQSFTQLLLPGEQLFAQIDPAGPAERRVVVSQVTF